MSSNSSGWQSSFVGELRIKCPSGNAEKEHGYNFIVSWMVAFVSDGAQLRMRKRRATKDKPW